MARKSYLFCVSDETIAIIDRYKGVMDARHRGRVIDAMVAVFAAGTSAPADLTAFELGERYERYIMLVEAILGIPDPQSKYSLDRVGPQLQALLAAFAAEYPRLYAILSARFALDGGLPMTLEEVGAHYGLTRERIRQLEGSALRKLRHPRRSNAIMNIFHLDF